MRIAKQISGILSFLLIVLLGDYMMLNPEFDVMFHHQKEGKAIFLDNSH